MIDKDLKIIIKKRQVLGIILFVIVFLSILFIRHLFSIKKQTFFSEKLEKKTKESMEKLTEKESEKPGDQVDIAWNIYKKLLLAKKEHNLELSNSFLYKPFDIDECISAGLSENECWDFVEAFSGLAIDPIKKSDFTIIEQDKKQIIMSTGFIREEGLDDTITYLKSYIYFVRNPENNILVLTASSSRRYFDVDMESESIIEALKDTDRDGLEDLKEMCNDPSDYREKCVKTNANEKDTDNDDWWDSIEIEAGTDPNSELSYPFSEY